MLFLKVIVFIGDIFGVALFGITFIGLKRMLKGYDRSNKEIVLSERDGERYNRYMIYMIIGFSIAVITSVINLILLFLNKSV